MAAAASLAAIGTPPASAQASPGALSVTGDPALASGTREVFHTCKVIGSAVDGVEAVHCADLFETPIPDDTPAWVAENEVLCQTTAGTLVECAGIHEQPEIANNAEGLGTVTDAGPRGVCGVRFGHSPCGARRVINASPSLQFVNDGDICEVWAVTVADSVVLPRSGVTVNAPNLATPHTTTNC